MTDEKQFEFILCEFELTEKGFKEFKCHYLEHKTIPVQDPVLKDYILDAITNGKRKVVIPDWVTTFEYDFHELLYFNVLVNASKPQIDEVIVTENEFFAEMHDELNELESAGYITNVQFPVFTQQGNERIKEICSNILMKDFNDFINKINANSWKYFLNEFSYDLGINVTEDDND